MIFGHHGKVYYDDAPLLESKTEKLRLILNNPEVSWESESGVCYNSAGIPVNGQLNIHIGILDITSIRSLTEERMKLM